MKLRICLVGVAALAVLLVLGAASGARANTIPVDPEVLFIGTGTGTSCATGGCPIFGNEVNGIGSSTFDLNENGNGQPALVDPVLIIFGVPSSTSLSGTLTTTLASSPSGPSTGSATVTPLGFLASFTSSSSGDAYETLGLHDGSSSESFVNWSTADLSALGINASSFGLFVFEISGTGLTGGEAFDMTFSGTLPQGTFIIGYGCKATSWFTSSTNLSQDFCAEKNLFSTPFTQSGVSTFSPPPPPPPPPVPEPATLMMLGSGLFALGGIFRRRLRVGG